MAEGSSHILSKLWPLTRTNWHTNGESSYGTRGGPFEPGLWGGSTHRDDKVYLHIMGWPAETLRLPSLKQRVDSARCLNRSRALHYGCKVEWKHQEDGFEISVPVNLRDALDAIVELAVEK